MPPRPGSIIDQLLRQAIREKRLVRFVYQDKERIVEPHDYGVINRIERLFCYQLAGGSTGRLPNWRLVDVSKVRDLELLEGSFAGSRGRNYEKHLNWDKVYARVK